MAATDPDLLANWFPSGEIAEAAVLVGLVAVSHLWPRLGHPIFRRLESALAGLAERRKLSVFLVGLLSLAGSAACGLLVRMPEPGVHDEFSYLLAADTFASGRLTNPASPMWQHFESMHIIQQPTYMSKYPPGQGLFLALGIVLGRDPIFGVWLSTALACGAICWMLQGWLPARWALWGGILAVLRFGIAGYYAQSYWGGSVALLGGALLFGALPRLWRAPSVRDALVMGAGLAILAITRPFEGAMAGLPVAAALAYRFARPQPFSFGRYLGRVAIPVALVLAGVAGWIAYDNHAVTGNALRLPYAVHEEQYGLISPFVFGKVPAPPVYRHEMMRKFFEEAELPYLKRQSTAGRLMFDALWKIRRAGQFPFGPLAILPLIFLPGLLRSPAMRFACGALVFFLGGLALVTFISPHYAAPIQGLWFLLIVQSVRQLRALKPGGKRVGLFAARALILTSVLFVVGQIRVEPSLFAQARALYQQKMEDLPGKHVVVVRYDAGHSPDMEWVYNRADLDAAKVIWARDMGDRSNRELLDFYKDRQPWILDFQKPAAVYEIEPYAPR